MKIKPNTVYLITPQNNLVVNDGTLELIQQVNPATTAEFPVDIFPSDFPS